MACAHLKDCHPNRIDIRVLRGKLFLEPTSKSELFGEQQLWRHPSSRALRSETGSCRTASYSIDNRGKPEVRQASAVLGIYQDVDLGEQFGVVTNCAVDQ